MANNFVNLYFLKDWSNYFNRRIKIIKESNIQEFLIINPNQVYTLIQDVNFNPNDGVTTEQVVNWNSDYIPDYLLIGVPSLSYTLITSKWYVTEAIRTRNGQMKMSLRRDLLSDYFDDIKGSKAFIEKAILQDDNPLIFNSEGCQFNQIKVNEELLQDETWVPWIVGYVARNSPTQDTPISGQSLGSSDYTFDNYPFSSLLPNVSESLISNVKGAPQSIKIIIANKSNTFNEDYLTLDSNGDIISNATKGPSYLMEPNTTYVANININGNRSNAMADMINYIRNNSTWRNSFKSESKTEFGWLNSTESVEFNNTNGAKILHVPTGQLYRINITNNGYQQSKSKPWSLMGSSYDSTKGLPYSNTLALRIYQMLNSTSSSNFTVNDNHPNIGYDYTCWYYQLELIPITDQTPSVTIKTSRTIPKEAAYDMFCIPYSNIIVHDTAQGSFEAIGDISKSIASAIQRSQVSLYDIQLLPYCPRRDCIIDTNEISLLGLTEHSDYELIQYTSEGTSHNVGVLIWCNKTSDTFQIKKEINVSNVKIDNECTTLRLCSPNYQGMFDFNVAKNGGVSYFNVDITYKPYSPYIHVAPSFGGLYGASYGDARGLICGGDFSMPMINDAWSNYQMQNKNYQNIFDREVQSLEFNRRYQRADELTGVISGTIQGAINGAGMGGVAGAIAGGVISAGAGVYDLSASESKYKEALDLRQDMFNYQLGNIKALPYSLAKVGAYNSNFKYYPFLEYYDCTEQERQHLADKIELNGMTVNAIDTLNAYIGVGNYIKCQLIRLEGLSEDTNLINAIYFELLKGAYY